MSQLLEITGLGDRPSLLCRQRVGSLDRYARKLHDDAGLSRAIHRRCCLSSEE